MELKDNIFKLMEEQSLNQKQLAKKADIPQITLSRLKKGANISRGTIEKIARALGVSPSDLMKGEIT